jgi:hypothetical protein
MYYGPLTLAQSPLVDLVRRFGLLEIRRREDINRDAALLLAAFEQADPFAGVAIPWGIKNANAPWDSGKEGLVRANALAEVMGWTALTCGSRAMLEAARARGWCPAAPVSPFGSNLLTALHGSQTSSQFQDPPETHTSRPIPCVMDWALRHADWPGACWLLGEGVAMPTRQMAGPRTPDPCGVLAMRGKNAFPWQWEDPVYCAARDALLDDFVRRGFGPSRAEVLKIALQWGNADHWLAFGGEVSLQEAPGFFETAIRGVRDNLVDARIREHSMVKALVETTDPVCVQSRMILDDFIDRGFHERLTPDLEATCKDRPVFAELVIGFPRQRLAEAIGAVARDEEEAASPVSPRPARRRL